VPAATARQADRQDATGGSTGRDRRIGRTRQADRQGATDRSTRRNHTADRSSFMKSVGGGATGRDGSRSWLDAADGHSQQPGRVARSVPGRCPPPDPVTRCRVRRSNLGPPPARARVARLCLSPLRPRQADRRFLEVATPTCMPRRACPDVPSTRPRDDPPVPDVARWPSGQRRRMATPRDLRRDGSGNLSSLLVYHGGASWTGVSPANGGRQIRRARRRNRRLVRQPPWRGETRRSPTTSFDVPGIPLPTRAPRELGNATNALGSPAMSPNAPDFDSFVLHKSGATHALANRALETVATCRDISFQVGFQWMKVRKNPQIPN
jgi:hypothetical protein